jgi:SAM-dependent methyltransferase
MLMRYLRVFLSSLFITVLWAGLCLSAESLAPYVPSPMEVVDKMLELAQVTEDDVVYDLGCGDGRIVVMAAKKYGAKGVGVDIDPERVKESKENARKEKVEDRVTILLQDAFETNLSDATVVTLYLLSESNLRLRPKLFMELKPGARVVSHDFGMGDWEPERVLKIDGKDGLPHTVYLWTIPAQVGGIWRWKEEGGESILRISQDLGKITGVYIGADKVERKIEDPMIKGNKLSFSLSILSGGKTVRKRYEGIVEGDRIKGKATVEGNPEEREWTAKRDPVNYIGRWRWEVLTPEGRTFGEMVIGKEEGGKIVLSWIRDGKELPVSGLIIQGACFRFDVSVDRPGIGRVRTTYKGFLEGDTITGTARIDGAGGEMRWEARRVGG